MLGDYLRRMLNQEYSLLYEDEAIRVYGRRLVLSSIAPK